MSNLTDKQKRFCKEYLIDLNATIPPSKPYVYAILEDGKICYIGKGVKKRVLNHFKKSDSLISNMIAINPDRYSWTIVDEFDSDSEAFQAEKNMIYFLKDKGVKLYNCIHYKKDKQRFKDINLAANILTNLSSYWFKNNDIVSLKELASLTLEILKRTTVNIPKERLPNYFNIDIQNLTFDIIDGDGFQRIQLKSL